MSQTKEDIQLEQLEEMIEHYYRETREMERIIKIAEDHYSYRDKLRACFIIAEDLQRFHISILGYKRSVVRTREIRDKVYGDPKYTDLQEVAENPAA